MKTRFGLGFTLSLVFFQATLLSAQVLPAKPPYTLEKYYSLIIPLWDDGDITSDEAIGFAKKRGITFDIDDLASFKQKLLARDKSQQNSDKIAKEISELVKVVEAAESATAGAEESAEAKAATNAAAAGAKASAMKDASQLAADAATKAEAATEAAAAAKSAAAKAAVNPDDTTAAAAKITTAAAAAAADQQAAVASTASEAASAKAFAPVTTNSNFRSLPFFVTGGAEFQSPFAVVVNGSHGTLTNAGNTTVAFVEFDYVNRYAGRVKDYAEDTNLYNEWCNSKSTLFGGYLQVPWKHVPDYQVDVGFVFDNGNTVTNQSYNAQTLAGGGDFYADFGFGLPIWRRNDLSLMHKVQVSIESWDGVVTEKTFEEVHPNAFVGLGLQSSISALGITNCLLSARIGAGWLDLPEVQAGNSVRLDDNNLPVFQLTPECEMSTYLLIPIGGVFLTVGANTYFGDGPPDAWNIKVGATIPFTSFKSILGQ